MPPCPICRRPAAPRGDNASFPFCGTRCKGADLGNWLDQRYAVIASESGAPNGRAAGEENYPEEDE